MQQLTTSKTSIIMVAVILTAISVAHATPSRVQLLLLQLRSGLSKVAVCQQKSPPTLISHLATLLNAFLCIVSQFILSKNRCL